MFAIEGDCVTSEPIGNEKERASGAVGSSAGSGVSCIPMLDPKAPQGEGGIGSGEIVMRTSAGNALPGAVNVTVWPFPRVPVMVDVWPGTKFRPKEPSATPPLKGDVVKMLEKAEVWPSGFSVCTSIEYVEEVTRPLMVTEVLLTPAENGRAV